MYAARRLKRPDKGARSGGSPSYAQFSGNEIPTAEVREVICGEKQGCGCSIKGPKHLQVQQKWAAFLYHFLG